MLVDSLVQVGEDIFTTISELLQVVDLLSIQLGSGNKHIDILDDNCETSESVPMSALCQSTIQHTYSSETWLNWLGAPANSFRILLPSSRTVRKSPILNPKLISSNPRD
jgi:hypothetical protein